VALSTAIIAVVAAISTMYLGKFSSRTIMAQSQETDQWAFYQAKSIKAHTFSLQKERMELDMMAQGKALPVDVAQKYRDAIAGYEKTVKRYDTEKEEIKKKAEELAAQKTLSQERGGNFGYGLIFLQIAVMLSSISAITKKPPLWYLGLFSAAVGTVFALNGFYLFFKF
jgi:hypothetical protein